jgi:hypothetical protein
MGFMQGLLQVSSHDARIDPRNYDDGLAAPAAADARHLLGPSNQVSAADEAVVTRRSRRHPSQTAACRIDLSQLRVSGTEVDNHFEIKEIQVSCHNLKFIL